MHHDNRTKTHKKSTKNTVSRPDWLVSRNGCGAGRHRFIPLSPILTGRYYNAVAGTVNAPQDLTDAAFADKEGKIDRDAAGSNNPRRFWLVAGKKLKLPHQNIAKDSVPT